MPGQLAGGRDNLLGWAEGSEGVGASVGWGECCRRKQQKQLRLCGHSLIRDSTRGSEASWFGLKSRYGSLWERRLACSHATSAG